jgi:hypothetical protein
VPHAVQRRNDRRSRTDRGGKVFDRGIERISLNRQQHGIVGLRDGIGGDELGPKGDVAVRADDPQAGCLKLRDATRAHEKGDIPPGLGQASAKIPTGRAGTDNQETHICFFLLGSVRVEAAYPRQ